MFRTIKEWLTKSYRERTVRLMTTYKQHRERIEWCKENGIPVDDETQRRGGDVLNLTYLHLKLEPREIRYTFETTEDAIFFKMRFG